MYYRYVTSLHHLVAETVKLSFSIQQAFSNDDIDTSAFNYLKSFRFEHYLKCYFPLGRK